MTPLISYQFAQGAEIHALKSMSPDVRAHDSIVINADESGVCGSSLKNKFIPVIYFILVHCPSCLAPGLVELCSWSESFQVTSVAKYDSRLP